MILKTRKDDFMNSTMNQIGSANPLKRLLAFACDLALSIGAAMIALWGSPNSPISIIEMTWLIFVMETIVTTLIVGDGTLGDHFLKLKVVAIGGASMSCRKVLARNVSYALMLYLPLVDLSDHAMVILGVVVIAFGYITIFSNRNKYHENMTAIDFVFKTLVVAKVPNQTVKGA